MGFRVVAFDVDGTLLTSDHRILPSTLDAIATVRAAGAQLVIASGRTPASVVGLASRLGLDLSGTVIVGVNGAQLADASGRELLRRPLGLPLMRELIRAGRDYGVTVTIPDDDRLLAEDRTSIWPEQEATACQMGVGWYDDLTEVTRPPVKVLFLDEPERLAEIAPHAQARFGDRVTFTVSAPTYLEANALGVSKASTLRLYCEQLGVPMSEVMAFGDHGNDLEMLAEVGLGVAMGNAIDAVKAVADLVTASNDADGIAQVIARHF